MNKKIEVKYYKHSRGHETATILCSYEYTNRKDEIKTGWHSVDVNDDVTLNAKYEDVLRGYKVNWSAIGSQDTETAELYADMIKKACEVAKELTKKHVK